MSNKLLSMLDVDTRIEILRKNWMSHDAKIQMTIVREFGWEKGNKLNKQIIGEMGKVMMFRLMNALGISKIENAKEFEAIIMTAINFYYPPPISSIHFKHISDNVFLGVVEKCSTYENVKKIDVVKHYECGCFAMRSGWYEALGLKVKEELGKCLKNGDEACEVTVRIEKWSSSSV